MQANRHTIVLMQSSPNRATRTFMDYGSISQAMDGSHLSQDAEIFIIVPICTEHTSPLSDRYVPNVPSSMSFYFTYLINCAFCFLLAALTTQFKLIYHTIGCGSNIGCSSTLRDWLHIKSHEKI
ncbi:hypothetical protein GW17_00000728 [Ensete ventricosum]|nr:hypothetical protein GW17_00000728 [Ensete ventricosum]